MRLESVDEVFVRACHEDVHAYVRDPAGYGAWWPGARSRPARDGAALELRPPGLSRVQRLRVTLIEERPGLGLRLGLRGDFAGDAEWYYLDEGDGTLVHYLVRGQMGGRGAHRRLARHRWVVREGLHALKDLLESGRSPGQEPGSSLRGLREKTVERQRAAPTRARGRPGKVDS